MKKPTNKNRNKSYYRHHRDRVIKLKAEKFTYSWSAKDKEEFFKDPKSYGRFNKGAAYCSCDMCRFEQKNGIQKDKVKATEKYYDNQIENYFNRED